MIRNFLNWLFGSKKSSEKDNPNLPKLIGNDERLCRAIFSPININKNGTSIKPNAFKTPDNKDEISVNRLNFTTPHFCKTLAKKKPPTTLRNYHGFAILFLREVLEVDCTCTYTPILKPIEEINYFHSDIHIGYIPIGGVWIAEMTKKADDLSKKSRFYKDPNPSSQIWEGKELL